jgi:hypothetical protein
LSGSVPSSVVEIGKFGGFVVKLDITGATRYFNLKVTANTTDFYLKICSLYVTVNKIYVYL